MAHIHGNCDDRFEPVRAALAQNVDSGEETGASIVVDLDGEIAADIWGGYRDEARTPRLPGTGRSSPRTASRTCSSATCSGTRPACPAWTSRP